MKNKSGSAREKIEKILDLLPPKRTKLPDECGWCDGTGFFDLEGNPRLRGLGGVKKCSSCNGTGSATE